MLRVDWNLLLTIINLLLLFVLMRIFLFKPVQKIIAARQEEADRQFKEAGESKQAAEEARKQYEASLANAEEAKKQVLQEARSVAKGYVKRNTPFMRWLRRIPIPAYLAMGALMATACWSFALYLC